MGGGIANAADGSATLTDTIVAANTGTGGAPSDIGGANAAGVVGTYNLIGTGGAGGIAGGTGDIVLTNLSTLGLAPLGNYGGPTQTMPLLPGSAALGTGTAIPGVSTDQRGEPLAAIPDIGAFQSQGFILTVVPGSTPQGAVIGTAFTNPLAVTVTAIDPIEPVAGGVVSFTANPAQNGASASLSAATAIIGSSGIAQVTATANSIVGSYTVTASAIGAATPATFNLRNLLSLTFSGIVSQSVSGGTASTTFSGTLANGVQTPRGEYVAVTLDGVTQQAVIGSSGAFSTTFNTAGLAISATPYTVSYVYTSDGTFADASTTSALTINAGKATPAIAWPNPADITYGTALSDHSARCHHLGARNLHVQSGPSRDPLRGHQPDPLGRLHAHGHDRLQHRFRVRDAQLSTRPRPHHLGQPRRHHLRYRALGRSAQCVGGLDGRRRQRNGRGIVHLHPGRRHRPERRRGTDPLGHVHIPPTPPITPLPPTRSRSTSIRPRPPSPGPSRPTSPTAPHSRQPSSMPPLLCREPSRSLQSDPGHGPPCGHRARPSRSSSRPRTRPTTTPASASVRFNVAKATPTITWANPAVIVYGTPLSATQLDATSSWTVAGVKGSVPGNFTYTPAAATVLPVGTGQTLSVTFAASDPVDYSTASATVPITVLDRVGTIEFSAAGYAVPENAGSATITVNRVNGARGIVKVDYQTVPINATPGLDFTPVSGTLTFPSGVTSQTIVVPVLANPYDHHDELVSVVLSNVQSTGTQGLGQAILGSPSTATLTIQDIDPNFNPLVVNSVQWTGTAQGITQIFVTFSKPLITSTAIDPANYALVNVGPDGKYGTLDDSGCRDERGDELPSSSFVVSPDPGPSTACEPVLPPLDQRRHSGWCRGPGRQHAGRRRQYRGHQLHRHAGAWHEPEVLHPRRRPGEPQDHRRRDHRRPAGRHGPGDRAHGGRPGSPPHGPLGQYQEGSRGNRPSLSRIHALGTGQLRRCPREDIFATVPDRPVSVLTRLFRLEGHRVRLKPGGHSQDRESQELDQRVQHHEPALPFVPPLNPWNPRVDTHVNVRQAHLDEPRHVVLMDLVGPAAHLVGHSAAWSMARVYPTLKAYPAYPPPPG